MAKENLFSLPGGSEPVDPPGRFYIRNNGYPDFEGAYSVVATTEVLVTIGGEDRKEQAIILASALNQVMAHRDYRQLLSLLKEGSELTRLIASAVLVVDMFDQANTGKNIERLGSRGSSLKSAIEDLRTELNTGQQRTLLDSEQANS